MFFVKGTPWCIITNFYVFYRDPLEQIQLVKVTKDPQETMDVLESQVLLGFFKLGKTAVADD